MIGKDDMPHRISEEVTRKKFIDTLASFNRQMDALRGRMSESEWQFERLFESLLAMCYLQPGV
ncbi:MAG: hypothetical protein C3F07_13145 [Anaerolineales bacterium]|nr:MAG: hypothetical protein C3F07_13145 [Anaerolineales bacterium]